MLGYFILRLKVPMLELVSIMPQSFNAENNLLSWKSSMEKNFFQKLPNNDLQKSVEAFLKAFISGVLH